MKKFRKFSYICVGLIIGLSFFLLSPYPMFIVSMDSFGQIIESGQRYRIVGQVEFDNHLDVKFDFEGIISLVPLQITVELYMPSYVGQDRVLAGKGTYNEEQGLLINLLDEQLVLDLKRQISSERLFEKIILVNQEVKPSKRNMSQDKDFNLSRQYNLVMEKYFRYDIGHENYIAIFIEQRHLWDLSYCSIDLRPMGFNLSIEAKIDKL